MQAMNVYGHFSLTGPPFAVQPDPRFAYETHEHRLANVKIAYSVNERRGLFLLQGEIGTGKTTLGKFLMEGWQDEPDRYVAANLVSSSSRSSAGFLRQVVEAFDLAPTRTIPALSQMLTGFLLEQHQAGKITVLLLDEAQLLSPVHLDILHSLSNLQTLSAQLLQIILLAQPNIQNKLVQRPALLSRITGGAYLGPLSLEDALGMLAYRVEVVGGDFAKIFAPETHKMIYNATLGIPRDLCVLADAALVSAYARDARTIDAAILAEALEGFTFKKWLK
jgi:general secretion pathway protein A